MNHRLMHRRGLLSAVAAALGTAPLAAVAQPTGRVYRLGILHPATVAPAADTYASTAYTAPLRELGYVEGQNLLIERHYAEGWPERLPALARQMIGLNPDVILAVGGAAARAAKDATTTIPIVLFNNVDPVQQGLVQSLARPGGNITGVLISPEGSLAGKRLELLRQLVPRATRMAMLAPASSATMMPTQVQETRAAASALGLSLEVVDVKGGDYAGAFAAMAAQRAQALVVGAAPAFNRDRIAIIEQAAKVRLPAIYEWPRQVKDGGLMSYGANDLETYKQVASYIDRIFKGAKPSDLPIWQPSRLYLVINLKTAKALGLTIPQTLLLRADEVIE